VSEIENYADPKHGLKKLDPKNYKWGIFEVCPYSSGNQRSPTKPNKTKQNCGLTDSDNCGLNKSPWAILKIMILTSEELG